MVICRKIGNETKVERYYNRKQEPQFLDKNNPTLGLKDSKVIIEGNFFQCSFSRQKKNDSVTNFFNLETNKYYILAAYGGLIEWFGTSKKLKAKI